METFRFFVLIMSLFFLQKSLDACTVCFSGGDADMTRGFFWGIVVLLALPFGLFATFVTYLVYTVKKRKSEMLPQ